MRSTEGRSSRQVGILASTMVACALLVSFGGAPAEAGDVPINLAHLDWLRREVRGPAGRPLTTWQIYASPATAGDRQGPYRFVGAPGEGIGCVDDVARAALVYLDHFDLTGSRESLAKARSALDFVRALRAGDGTYVNFIRQDGSLNTSGPTSRKGLDWWTARAFLATARGAHVFARIDRAYATRLARDADRTVEALRTYLGPRYGRFDLWGPVRIPSWFVAGAADVTALFVLGLATLHATTPSSELRELVERYARAIEVHRLGDAGRYPYHAHMPSNAVTHWHAYGAHMLEALATAGRLLGDRALLDGARLEADHFTTHLLIAGGPIWGFTPAPRTFPQIAYNVSAQGQGLLALYRATGERRYGVMAALMASWLLGNNPAGTAMYDAATGRVFDGIDAGRASAASGAESTIEGLSMLLDLERSRELWPYTHAREVGRRAAMVLEAESAVDANRIAVETDEAFSGSRCVRLPPGRTLELDFVAPAGEYLLSPVVECRTPVQRRSTVVRVSVASRSRTFEPIYPQEGAPWLTIEAGHIPSSFWVPARGRVRVTLDGRARQPLDVDCVIAQPVIEYRVFEVENRRIALVKSAASHPSLVRIPGMRRPTFVPAYDSLLVEE